MSVILIMIPAALVLAGLGIAAFIFAAKRGQFDDLETPAIRAVFDDDEPIQKQDRVPERKDAKKSSTEEADDS